MAEKNLQDEQWTASKDEGKKSSAAILSVKNRTHCPSIIVMKDNISIPVEGD